MKDRLSIALETETGTQYLLAQIAAFAIVLLQVSVDNDGVESGMVQLNERASVRRRETAPQKLQEGLVKVTLHDCLACSGCITSAETVLLGKFAHNLHPCPTCHTS